MEKQFSLLKQNLYKVFFWEIPLYRAIGHTVVIEIRNMGKYVIYMLKHMELGYICTFIFDC